LNPIKIETQQTLLKQNSSQYIEGQFFEGDNKLEQINYIFLHEDHLNII